MALLPGSRTIEVRELGPILVEAAARLLARDPRLRFVLPLAEPRFAADLAALVARHPFAGRIALVGDSHRALAAADLALMASGTASLEATLRRRADGAALPLVDGHDGGGRTDPRSSA